MELTFTFFVTYNRGIFLVLTLRLFWIQALHQMAVGKYFLPGCGLGFHSLTLAFHRAVLV